MQTDPIVLEIELSVTARAAWDAWNNPKVLRLWLAKDARVGAAIGESFELFWDADPRVDSTIGCKITACRDQRLLAFEWKGPTRFAEIMNVEPLPTWVRVELLAQSTDQTVIRLEHGGWQSGPDWEAARIWHESVWRSSLGELRSYLVSCTTVDSRRVSKAPDT